MDTYTTDAETGEEIEIPIAESPDLIASLLSFDPAELAGRGERPEDLLVHKACELKDWRVEGQHPRFLVEGWIEVFVTGQLQGYGRILNSRAHIHLTPFTLDTLLTELGKLTAYLDRHTTPEDFIPWLIAAYDELAEGPSKDIGLQDLYRLINSRQPAYRREAFGLDLGRTLAESPVLEGRRVRLGYNQGPLTQRYALCLGPRRSAQLADHLRIDAPLLSLDI